MVVPPIAVDETEPLKETKVRTGKPIWALLHIHPKGLVTLTSTGSDTATVKQLQYRVSKLIQLKDDGWKSNHFSVTYKAKHTWNRQVADAILNSLSRMKSFVYEKRSIVPIGNTVEWFSKPD